MPQMAPLLWLNLFIFFTLAFIMFLMSNYFLAPSEKSETPIKTMTPRKLNWKW